MNQLPPFVYAKAFWEALSAFVAATLALLAYFGYVNPDWAVPVSAISAWVFGLLRMFGIEPELRARVLAAKLERAEKLLTEAQVVRNDLLGLSRSAKDAKKSK